MRLAQTAHSDPAWDSMPDKLEANAKRALETIVHDHNGVLVGPAPLTRRMIEDEVMGHQSTMESLAALTAHGLLHARQTDETPVFWVPERLIATRTNPRRDRARASLHAHP